MIFLSFGWISFFEIEIVMKKLILFLITLLDIYYDAASLGSLGKIKGIFMMLYM